MNIEDIEIFSYKISGKLFFDYDLKKTNWFNIGGKSKIFFKPEKSTTPLTDPLTGLIITTTSLLN